MLQFRAACQNLVSCLPRQHRRLILNNEIQSLFETTNRKLHDMQTRVDSYVHNAFAMFKNADQVVCCLVAHQFLIRNKCCRGAEMRRQIWRVERYHVYKCKWTFSTRDKDAKAHEGVTGSRQRQILTFFCLPQAQRKELMVFTIELLYCTISGMSCLEHN